jgi:galactonate dehydratase
MEITDYELFEVPPRWLFLRVETSDGVVGRGEPIVEGRVETVRTAVGELMDDYLLGTDPLRIEEHWQAMYRGGFYRGGPILMSAIAGIDQALWDIKGTHYGAPVYDLLGGRARDRLRVYQWIGGDDPSDLAEEAKHLVDAGYTALKMDAIQKMNYIDTPAAVEAVVDRVRRVRNTVGPEVNIGVDFRGRIDAPMARRLCAKLDEFNLMFIEEPTSPEYDTFLGDIVRNSTTPIATGERLYSRWDCRPVLEDGIVDVIQCDVSHAGGITEVARIASMAETYNVAVAPNCPLGPIALAASLQIDTTVPNFLVQDHAYHIEVGDGSGSYGYLADDSVFHFEDGYVNPLDDPGLGIEIDEDVVRRKAQQDIHWETPLWRHPDGSIAEW